MGSMEGALLLDPPVYRNIKCTSIFVPSRVKNRQSSDLFQKSIFDLPNTLNQTDLRPLGPLMASHTKCLPIHTTRDHQSQLAKHKILEVFWGMHKWPFYCCPIYASFSVWAKHGPTGPPRAKYEP